jgi:ribosomal protein S18 acetylase RimI-like enzyme
MQIKLITEATEELFEAFQRLVPQLTSNNLPPTRTDLRALIESDTSFLLAATGDDGDIVGAACVTVYRVPTGIRAIIEDVIVDEESRGRGIGEALVRKTLEIARTRGAPAVTLTSNPNRQVANRLYQRMGFVLRETNAYVYKFK